MSKVTVHYKHPLLRRFTFNTHTGRFFCSRRNAVKITQRAGEGRALLLQRHSRQHAKKEAAEL